MDKVYSFPDREQVEKEAAEWLIKLDGDAVLKPEELQALREWMHISPAHRDELMSFGEFWNDQSLAALPIPLEDLYYEAPVEEPDTVWDFLRGYLWGHLWGYGYRHPLWSSAALIFIVISSVLMFSSNWLFWDTGPQYSEQYSNELYATAVGQQSTITLPDGSTVSLNTNSQIQVGYGDKYRNIFLLQGEAYFDVAEQPERPFRVYAGRSRVQAVGTAFTVYFRDNEDVDVTVAEGKVALGVLAQDQESIGSSGIPGATQAATNLSPAEEKLSKNSEYYVAISVDELGVLEAGQATTILVAQKSGAGPRDRLDNVKDIAKEEIERRGAWRSGLLVFAGNSLEEVVTEISRYTTLSIEIVDPELKEIRIGGRFSMASTDALFNALEANFGLEITRLDYNRVKISSAEKNKENQNTSVGI